MKKGLILPLSLVCLLAVAGCTSKKNESSSEKESSEPDSSEVVSSEVTSEDPVQYGITINNKEIMAAEWHVGDAIRNLNVSVTPAANVQSLVMKGEIYVTFTNEGVLEASGLGLTARTAGTTKAVVHYHDASDEVELTILPKESAITKYGTVHEGTYEDPLDNEDAIKVGLWAKDNGDTTDILYFKGIVDQFYHAPGSRTDGGVSWYMKANGTREDDKEPRFEVYLAYNATKVDGKYQSLTDDDIWVGAEVIASGKVTYYVDKDICETTGVTLFHEVTGGAEKPQPRETIVSTFTDVMALELADGESSWDYYQFNAYVVKKSGTNYFLNSVNEVAAKDTDMFELYSISDTEMAAKLMKGASVTVTTIVKNYRDQMENGAQPKDIVVLEEGKGWEAIAVNVAGALAVIEPLEAGASAKNDYKVTGLVKEVTIAYSEQYGNISFTMVDAMEDTAVLTVFRAATDATTAAKIVAGVELSVVGSLQKYLEKDGTTVKPELTGGTEVTILSEEEQIEYGTLENPLNIAEAKAVLDKTGANVSAEELTVKGVVYSSSYSTKYSNYTIWLQSDDGAVGEAFEIYAAQIPAEVAGEVDYTVENALVGKEIIAKGFGKVYNEKTYELTNVKQSDNSYIYPQVLAINAYEAPAPTSIVLDKEEANMKVGDELTLKVSVLPAVNNNTAAIEWESSNEDVATVAAGKISANAKGEATITAKLGELEATCAVTVAEDEGGEKEYHDATMAKGTTAYDDVTINGKKAIKMSSSKANGNMTITVASGATELVFYAVGWKGDKASIAISGATVDPANLDITSNDAISGSVTAFTLENEADYKVTIALSGITEETVITLNATKRVIVWGAQYAL